MKRQSQQGSIEAAVITCLVAALVLALGWVFWQNFIVKPAPSDSQTTPKAVSREPDSEIVDTSNPALKKYVNHKLGFSFEFPATAYEPIDCGPSDDADAPGYFITKEGMAEMTVVESGSGNFTVVQKRGPVFSPLQYDSGGHGYIPNCQVENITKNNIAKAAEGAMEMRTWFVVRAETKEDVVRHAPAAYQSTNLATKQQKVSVKFDKPNGDRQGVYIYPDPLPRASGFKFDAWFYPKKKIFAYYASGQSASFIAGKNSTKTYGADILDSFKLL